MDLNFQSLGKSLIFLGIVVIIVGVILYYFKGIPFLGKLPGDIHVVRKNFSFHFPIVTCIVLSLLISFVFYLFRR